MIRAHLAAACELAATLLDAAREPLPRDASTSDPALAAADREVRRVLGDDWRADVAASSDGAGWVACARRGEGYEVADVLRYGGGGTTRSAALAALTERLRGAPSSSPHGVRAALDRGLRAALDHFTHGAALDALRVERDALATQVQVLGEWYDERGDDVRRLEAVERDQAWRAQCELMRDASRDALRLAEEHAQDAVERLRGLLAAEEAHGATVRMERDALRASITRVAVASCLSPAMSADEVLDAVCAGIRVGADMLATLGLSPTMSLSELVDAARRMRAVVDAVLRYERAAVGASGAADALAWREVTDALRAARYEALPVDAPQAPDAAT